jgi:hypothetical protein
MAFSKLFPGWMNMTSCMVGLLSEKRLPEWLTELPSFLMDNIETPLRRQTLGHE